MFLGHAAVAFAAKPKLSHRSLGVLVAGAYLIDLVWPVLLLLGVERVEIRPGDTAFTPLAFEHYPWSHSLLGALGWGLLFAFVVLRGRLAPLGEAAWLVGLVLSHWLLDLVTHRSDLPLAPGADLRVGFGLWNSVAGTLLVEGAFFAVALGLYLRNSRAGDRTGTWALAGLVVLLAAIWASGPFSPPPPSARAIAYVGLLTWLIPLWAGWIDRHRSSRS